MNKNYQKPFPGVKNAGFTLIELLVVVLIIGILAAIAVPKYEMAAARASYQKLVMIGTEIAKAERLYYMANGRYTTDFSQLDLDFGEIEMGENTVGSYSTVDFGELNCNLRDYAPGTVQCQYKRKHNVPGFGVSQNFSVRRCYALVEGGELPRRVCEIETGTKNSHFSSGTYTYSYEN